MIICLEGINGAGKTTLATALAQRWSAEGRSARLHDPIALTQFGQQVRTAIMATTDLSVDAETLAFVSARLHGASVLDRSIGTTAQDLLILERWQGAVVAYGRVAGTNPFLLRSLEAVLTGALPIDQTFLIDIPGAIAARRLARQGDPNRFETSGSAYLERVRRQYLTWAGPRHTPVLDGTRPPGRLTAELFSLINPVRTVKGRPA